MNFINTKYAQIFFNKQVPALIKALDRIADNQETMISNGTHVGSRTSPPPTSNGVDTIFVCYEENSVSLYAEAGNINKMFVTSDIELAKEWAKHSVKNAAIHGYRPIAEQDYLEFMSHIGDKFASMWVYLGRRENARENYGICVDAFSPEQSKEQLERLFPLKG